MQCALRIHGDNSGKSQLHGILESSRISQGASVERIAMDWAQLHQGEAEGGAAESNTLQTARVRVMMTDSSRVY